MFPPKEYKFKKGDVVKQKVTGWKVILLNNNWLIDQAKIGEWSGKIWKKTVGGDNTGFWEEGNFFENELEDC